MFIPPHKPITRKRLEQLHRNSSSQTYREWKEYCLERDEHKCQFVFNHGICNSTKRLQVHHIRRFKDAPGLKVDKFNGITLCRRCHEAIYNRERDYELQFFLTVRANEKRFQQEQKEKIEKETKAK